MLKRPRDQNIAPELQEMQNDSLYSSINIREMIPESDSEIDDDDLLAAFSDHSDELEDDEDDEDESGANLMSMVRDINRKSNKKRKFTKQSALARAMKTMDPEVVKILSEANDLYVARDYENAEKKYLEVIQKDSKNFSAYKSLGEIYRQQGLGNKCCNAWFLAAHINPNDGSFWHEVATMSAEFGHITQALYCYSRAIGAGQTGYDVLLERAILYRENGQLGRASESLSKILELYPTESSVLRQLAMIYNQLNRTNDAIAMYLKSFEKNSDYRKHALSGHPVNPESKNFPIFDWSSLNILAELFVNQKNYTIAIRTIKHIARWIQERENEEFWEDVNDDSEFDERRYANSKFEALPDIYKTKTHKLPIDIRVKLGSLRLSLNNIDEALIHYAFLLNDDITETIDLYLEAASRLEDAQLFGDAIKFFQPLSKLEELQNGSIFNSLGRCYTELGNYDKAKESYNKALEFDPDNIDIQLALVEVLYYLEEIEESQALLQHINELRKKLEERDEDKEMIGDNDKIVPESEALIENRIFKPLKRDSRLTEAEKLEKENRIKQNVIEKYNRLQRLHIGLESGDEIAAVTWIQLASELIEIFSNVKSFFPKDRSRIFRGIITRSKSQKLDLDSKIQRISDIYEGFTSTQSVVELSSTEEYQGLDYNQWFQLFMEYALAIARFESPIDANSIIDNAKNVNVFFQDKSREKIMNLVKLSIVIRTSDQKDILLSLRAVLNSFQFHKKLLKLFLLSQSSGKQATENFISINHQKYFLRQIKGYDSVNSGKPIPGMATITNKDINPEGKDNVYLMYIYACLLFTNRSYVPSLVYFTRIYKSYKKEPIVTLLAGLAHVHRSMQRSSQNRHLELLQGIKYVMEYFELRTSSKFGRLEEQEALYNLGRIFHLLGLFPIAIDYYNQVLKNFDDLDIEKDLKRHTAYNLVLIYNNSGNTRLSNKIMEDYLTI